MKTYHIKVSSFGASVIAGKLYVTMCGKRFGKKVVIGFHADSVTTLSCGEHQIVVGDKLIFVKLSVME